MKQQKLVAMANQIARFFETQPGTDRADRLAAHINDFWDPSMRAGLIAALDAGGAGLSPLVIEAAEAIRAPEAALA